MAKKKTTAVGKTAKPAKTPVPTRQKLQSEITSLHREVSSLKHGTASKKHKTTASKKHKTKTGLALAPGDVACCAAQALAASLRLALGVTVHDEDMLGLYWRAAHDPEGTDVLDVLRAAREYGLAGARPASIRQAWPGEIAGGLLTCGNGNACTRYRRSEGWPGAVPGGLTIPRLDLLLGALAGQWGQRAVHAGDLAASGTERLQIGVVPGRNLADVPHFAAPAPAEDRQPGFEFGLCGNALQGVGGVASHIGPVNIHAGQRTPLILELDLPGGPHAVAAAPDGTWWSWGEPYSPGDFTGAVIEDAWAVSWS